MIENWVVTLRGGGYDGMELEAVRERELKPVLIVWKCSRACLGHGTFIPDNPAIRLDRAVAYRQCELDADALTAVYEVGEPQPSEDRELVLAGVGEDDLVAQVLRDYAHIEQMWKRYIEGTA